MSYKATFLLLSLFICSTLFSANNWKSLNSGTNNMLVYVDFIDSNTGLVVGSPGTILRTEDAGKTWTVINIGITNNLSTVDFVTKDLAFITGDNGLILKSTDGGKTWNKLTSGVSSMLYSVNFATTDIGYAAGIGGVIIKTTDGGNSWNQQNSATSNHIYRINFLNKDTGYVAARDGDIARTYNGGKTWTKLTSGTTTLLNYINFKDKNNGLAVGDNGLIISTNNGGNSWKNVNSGTGFLLNCIKFAGKNNVYTVGLNGLILKSTNSGQTWQNDNSGTTDRLVSICFPNEYIGYAVGANGRIVKTVSDTITIKYCSEDSTATLIAPTGSQTYSWINPSGTLIGNNQQQIIKHPNINDIYSCAIKGEYSDTLFAKIAKYELNADFTAQITNCSTNSVQFSNSSTSSHSPVSYLWSFDDGTTSNVKNPTHSFTTPGSHKVTLSISNPLSSCNDTITKIIDTYSPMKVRIEGDSLCCEGFNITLKAIGAETYLWSNGSTADSILVNENAGKVWLLGYYGNGICISDTVYKTIKNGSPPISISGHKTYCPGLTTVIKANGASKYEWSNGLVTDSIQVSSPGGNYWLLGQSKGGCYSDTLFFNITEEPDWSFAISGNPYFCKNDSTEMFVHGGSSYLWSNSKTTSSILIKYAGSYSVSAVNERGCQKTIDLDIIEHPLPDVEFSVSKNQVDNRNNRLNCHLQPVAGTVYDWDFGDGMLDTGADVEHKYNVDNSLFEYTITLKATNSFGCQATSRKSIDIVPYVPNVFSPNKDGINDRFMPNVQTQVFDRYGICLYNGTIGWDGTFKAKLAGQDTYFYFISYYDKYQQVHTLKGSVTLIR